MPEFRQACRVSVPGASTQPVAISWESGEAAAATAFPVGVEQRDVPVAVAACEPDLHLTRALHQHDPRLHARRAGP